MEVIEQETPLNRMSNATQQCKQPVLWIDEIIPLRHATPNKNDLQRNKLDKIYCQAHVHIAIVQFYINVKI